VYEMKEGMVYGNKLLFLRLSNSKRDVDAPIQFVDANFRGLLIVSELVVGE